MKCNVRGGQEGGASLCVQSPAHVLAACVACSHVHSAVRCRCLVSQQPLFSNRRQGNKSFAHTQLPHPFACPLVLPAPTTAPPVAVASKLTTIKRFSARAVQGRKFTSDHVAMARTVYCRPKNYSVHKLLNAKSFDFNYAENFYCQTCGCRTRTFAA